MANMETLLTFSATDTLKVRIAISVLISAHFGGTDIAN